MIVGYKLIDSTSKEVIKQFGGVWGQCPGVPNPIVLPNGDRVHAPSLNEDYDGYMLIEWDMEEPVIVPENVDAAQIRLLLLQQNLLTTVESMVAASDKATQIEWEFRTKYQRNNELLLSVAKELNLDDATLDQFFIQASKI